MFVFFFLMGVKQKIINHHKPSQTVTIFIGGFLTYKVGPSSYKLAYKPHEYYSYKYHKPYSDIGVMFTNWTLSNGGPTLYHSQENRWFPLNTSPEKENRQVWVLPGQVVEVRWFHGDF